VGALLHDPIERRPYGGGLLGMKAGADLDKAILQLAPRDVALLAVEARIRIHALALNGGVLAADAIELGTGRVLRHLHQRCLVGWRRHTRDRADLAVREHAAPQLVIDERQLAKALRDADPIARGLSAPADAPRQPLGARPRALLVPAVGDIELTHGGEQPMRRRIEVSSLLCDPFPKLLDTHRHAHSISNERSIVHRWLLLCAVDDEAAGISSESFCQTGNQAERPTVNHQCTDRRLVRNTSGAATAATAASRVPQRRRRRTMRDQRRRPDAVPASSTQSRLHHPHVGGRARRAQERAARAWSNGGGSGALNAAVALTS